MNRSSKVVFQLYIDKFLIETSGPKSEIAFGGLWAKILTFVTQQNELSLKAKFTKESKIPTISLNAYLKLTTFQRKQMKRYLSINDLEVVAIDPVEPGVRQYGEKPLVQKLAPQPSLVPPSRPKTFSDSVPTRSATLYHTLSDDGEDALNARAKIVSDLLAKKFPWEMTKTPEVSFDVPYKNLLCPNRNPSPNR